MRHCAVGMAVQRDLILSVNAATTAIPWSGATMALPSPSIVTFSSRILYVPGQMKMDFLIALMKCNEQ